MSSLRSYFVGVASKYLSAVDATPRSNQHEIGSNKFKLLLGDPGADKLRFDATFLYFSGQSEDAESSPGTVTYYDTRFGKRRPELRLYYRDNPVIERIKEGDFCLLAMRPDRTLMIAFAERDSDAERRLRYLFDIDEATADWEVIESVSPETLDLATASILRALGIEPVDAEEALLGAMVDRFGLVFPATRAFSEFTRETCKLDVEITRNADIALERWMGHEERLFRALERQIVGIRIKQGFDAVDEFVAYSLSVQNRRKSRVGHALENHLEAIFKASSVQFERGAKTEGHVKPDFLFPGSVAYRDPAVTSPPLRMLAAKSTCKDRWRQVLSEAARIPDKHLCTLETAISTNQTDEMRSSRVTLVLPDSIARTYTASQRQEAIRLQDFVDLVR